MTQTDRFLAETPLLDFRSPTIAALVAARGWQELPPHQRIGAAYDFVRNEIAFGYNARDELPASRVLADGYGQCNTKATLLMALLRALGIPCRLHGFTVHKSLQRGVVPELVYRLAPENIVHSWVEILHQGRWTDLEGFIIDDPLLAALQARFAGETDSLCGYGVGTDCLSAPPVRWQGEATYVQRTGINRDLSLFDTPDAFYAAHGQELGFLRGLIYQHVVRHWMNRRVRAMRGGAIPEIPGGPRPAPGQRQAPARQA